MPGVAQAVVDTHEREPGLIELVGYYTARPGRASTGRRPRSRARVPRYMVPAYFEGLAGIPTLPSDKVDRKRLPTLPRPGSSRQAEDVEPADEIEAELAVAVAELLGLDRVSVEAHFFDDLGMSSLSWRSSARVRERLELRRSMRDAYLNPTVRELATVVQRGGAAGAGDGPARGPRTVSTASPTLSWPGAALQAALYLGAAVRARCGGS